MTGRRRLWTVVVLLLLAAAAACVWVTVSTQRRVGQLEQELVRRQQLAQSESAEAKLLAKQAQESALESGAKVALLQARLSEVAVQRGQLDDLVQSLSRSRDENLVIDIDSALRVAQRQALITGSAEPLVAALKQADERLVRYNQPRLEGVRRAIARDLDKVKAVGVAEISALTIKLDEVVRLVDELPLVSSSQISAQTSVQPSIQTPGQIRGETPHEPIAVKPASAPTAAPSVPGRSTADWTVWTAQWPALLDRVWSEVRSLLRVTRIDHPEAMLIAPEQAFFLRENLKLRLLNARLALLSRQFDTAQSDVRTAQGSLARYFDRGSRKATLAAELLQQVATQSRQVTLPQPDETLSALTTAAAGR